MADITIYQKPTCTTCRQAVQLLKDSGKPYSQEANYAKLFGSEIATKAALEAIQIHGGYGYINEFPVERYLRDAKLLEIGEGTSEIIRMVIARGLGLR